jgi:hypothetical protein
MYAIRHFAFQPKCAKGKHRENSKNMVLWMLLQVIYNREMDQTTDSGRGQTVALIVQEHETVVLVLLENLTETTETKNIHMPLPFTYAYPTSLSLNLLYLE